MWARWRFYLGYGARNLLRGSRWTVFAVFCIAAGVATVVSLRALGLAIGDSLIDNARINNHGDITISVGGNLGSLFGNRDDESDVFSVNQVAAAERWARENNAQMAGYHRSLSLQVTALDGTTVGRPQFVTTILVDPATYSPAGVVRADQPAGAPLSELLPGGREIVVSSNLAQAQGIALGDLVRVSNTTETFTVTGIVSAALESQIENPISSFFGFAYLNANQAELLQVSPQPNALSFALPPGLDPRRAADNFRAQTDIYGSVRTLPDILETYATISDVLGRFIVVMGLGALLIGGVGIINTMLAVVARRTNEIAALKTFGLKGRQIATMFMTEAFLLGLVGSAVGSIVGVLLSGFVNQYGELFLQQRLVWRVYPEAILLGFALGMVVTLVFGVLPVLTANRIRPAIILRPDVTMIPVTGVFHSVIALLLIVIVIGGAAGQIIGSTILGIIGVAITLVILGFLTFVMWLIVVLIGLLPSFGIVDVQLALRNMRARRVRTATTLLALSAGMFALSSISFVGMGTREILQFQVTQNFGGNVAVFSGLSLVSRDLAQTLLNARLSTLEGVEYSTVWSSVGATIEQIDGVDVEVELPFMDDLPPGAERAFQSIVLIVRRSTNPNLSSGRLLAGRDLTPEDVGKRVMVVSQTDFLGLGIAENIQVGAQIDLRYRSGAAATFEVVGIVQGATLSLGQAYIPVDSAPDATTPGLTILQVTPEHLNEVLLGLSELPFALAIDLQFLDSLLARLIDQFSAIPTVVGVLSLIAAAVAMANTVSLSTLERRRQIGILKAIGAKPRRVLGVMLLENTLVGLLGGVLGIGLSGLGVSVMTAVGLGDAVPIPRDAIPTALALIVAAVLIAVVATLLSAQVALRERVVEVLRYD